MNLDTTIFKQIAENNWEPIVFANLEGSVVYTNPAADNLYGYEKGELIGENVDIFNAQISHDTGHIVQAIIDHGGWSGEIIQRRKNGETFTALLTVSLVFDESGEPAGYASNSKDISERVKEKELLKTALRDKDILFQEIHHRLKNNLAIISSILELQSLKSNDEVFIRAIQDSQRRIKTTALAHEVLYENETLEIVDLNNFVENLLANVSESLGSESRTIEISKKFSVDSLNVNMAVPMGLIMNELITNSFKHAFPESQTGKINIEIHKEGEDYSFLFEDNGVGLNADFNIDEADSTGMIVVNSLVEQLEGNLKVESEGGTRYSINFKSN